MIAGIIVVASIVLAGVFTLAYFMRPAVRAQVERPKFVFHDQLQRYNRHCEENTAHSDRQANDQ